MTEDIPREDDGALGYGVAVGLLEADLLLPLCHSLKDKRGVLAKTLNHLRKLHPISAAEVAKHDAWGRAGIAAAVVSGDRATAERILMDAVRTLERDREVQLVNWAIQWL